MKNLIALIAAIGVFVTQATAFDFSVSGTGTSQTQGNHDTAFGTAIRVETFVLSPFSLGLVQTFGVSDGAQFNTELFGAYNVNYTVFGVTNTAFAGAAANYGYGNRVGAWYAGPLVGNRVFIRENVYVLAQANYDVGLNNAADNIVRYSLGIGVRF